MLSPARLQQRSCLLQTVRSFFSDRSYLEVDTPVRLPVLIPEAEIIPVQSEDWYLQTSPELCMKRLLAGGCSRLFQICPCFRKGERGHLHREEFTLLEWYQVGWSYTELMVECEEMIQCIANRMAGTDRAGEQTAFFRSGKKISLAAPWQRLTVADAFERYAGMSAVEAVDRGLFDELLVEKVEPHLGWQRPVFLYDYPVALASLARIRPDNPEVAERFELYIGGLELANGFSELTDPEMQRQRFALQLDKINLAGWQQAMPEKFIQSLSDLPDCAGIALGLDRLLMLCVGAQSIAEVVPFGDQDL